MADQKYLSDEEAGFGKKPGGDGQKYLSDAEVGFSQPEESNLARGFKTAMRQVPQTFGGAAALVGDAVGSKGLRDWGLDVYKGQEDKIREMSRDSDSFTNVLKGDADLSDWAGYGAGYVGGQALQSLATGGVGGFIGKKAAEIGARKIVEEGVKRGAEEVAKQQAKQQVRKGIERGAGTGLFGSNLMQEAGSIYPEAIEQAREDGRLQDDGGLSGGDLARAGVSAVGAAALDTLMEAKIAKGILGGGTSADPNVIKRVLKEGAKGAGREALTEGMQTGMERWGAQQSLGDQEAVQDYIDSAALGALGGGMGGAPAGLRGPRQARGFTPEGDQVQTPPSDEALGNAAQPLALPAPVIDVGGNGVARTADDRNARLQRLASGDVTDITPIREEEIFDRSARTPIAGELYQSGDTTNPFTGERIPAKPSEVMGLDPNSGTLSEAAAVAVDSGASPVAAMADEDGVLPEAAVQDATTAQDSAGLSAWSNADLSTAFQNAQQKEIRQQLAQELQRRREVREQQALQQEMDAEQSALDMPDAPDDAFANVREDAGAPNLQDGPSHSVADGVADKGRQPTVSQQPKEASSGTQAQETQQAGAGQQEARAAQAGSRDESHLNALEPDGAEKTSTAQPPLSGTISPQPQAAGPALAAPEFTTIKTVHGDSVTVPEAALQTQVQGQAPDNTIDALRQQLRAVEAKIIEAAPAAMGQGGGDIDAAMKSRKVPVTLKAQRKKLKEQIQQAQSADGSQSNQPQAQTQQAQAAIDNVASAGQQATHLDPGETPEVATAAVVAQSVKTAARNEGDKPSAMRKWLVDEVDAAIAKAQAPDAAKMQALEKANSAYAKAVDLNQRGRHADALREAAQAIGFVTFDVPGDGKFKVLNTPEGLQAFRKKVLASPGFKDSGQDQDTRVRDSDYSGRNGSASVAEAIKNFLSDGDVRGALEFAQVKGVEFTPVAPQMRVPSKGGKARHIPASVTSKPAGVADGLTQIEREQLNQYLTAQGAQEQAGDAPVVASKFPKTDIRVGDTVRHNGNDYVVDGGVAGGISATRRVAEHGSGVTQDETIVLRGDDAVRAWREVNVPAPETSQQGETPVKPATAAAPAPKKPRGILAKKAEAEERARAEYFTPGNVIKSYSGHDRVVKYNPNAERGGWEVKVRAVRKDGDVWVDVPGERERHHSTQPDAKELKAGPVGRVQSGDAAKVQAQEASTAAPKKAMSPEERMAALVKAFNDTPEYLPLSGDVRVAKIETETLGVKGAGWYVVRDGKKISLQFSTRQQATAYMDGLTGEPNPERERLRHEIAAAAKQATQKTAAPTDFIPAPDGGLDYGEITPAMGKEMRRQAGKIRLRRGDEKWGLTHIEQRHAKDFAALGFKNAQDFVATVASGFGKIYQGRGAALDMVLESDKAHGMLIVSLELSPDGDFYDIKTATPIRRDQFKNEEPLWERAGPSAPVVKDNPSYPRGQSGDASVPVSAPQSKTEPQGAAEKRNIWIPNMTVRKLERLLSKSERTTDDIEDLKDFRYFLLNDLQSAEEKGFYVRYVADNGGVPVLKNKFWLTNIEAAISDGLARKPSASSQSKAQPITKDTAADLQAGDIVVDANGKEYRAHAARHKWLEAHPIENGKANVSADTLVRFHLDLQTASEYPERNPGPVFKKASGGDAARQRAGEIGRSLSRKQRDEVLKTLVDVYKKKGAPREYKGAGIDGNERVGYAYSPDLFERSDITGAMVRYYVTLPDGRKAHPSELFPDYKQSDIDKALAAQRDEEARKADNEESRKRILQSRKADSLTGANRIFNVQNRGPRTYTPATLSDGQQYVRTAPETADEDAKLLGDGWRVTDPGAEAAQDGGQAADAAQDKLTPTEAKALMVWEDMGTKGGVKTHVLRFYESQADMDAKRGHVTIATVTKGDRSASNWTVDGDDKRMAMLGMAKKRAEEMGLEKLVRDGFVAQEGNTAPEGAQFPMQEAVSSYAGISHRGQERAQSDADEFERFISSQQEAGLAVAETEAQKAAAAQAVDALRADYVTAYRRLMGVRAGTYSAYVAGRSGLNSRQADRSNRALDKAMENFSEWQAAASGRVRRAVLDARTDDQKQADQHAKEQAQADKAQRREDSDRSLMRKILTWKKGGEAVPIGKSATLSGVNLGRDGYPSSVNLKPNDGSTLTSDKFDLASLFRRDGMSVPDSRRRVRELVDAVRTEDATQWANQDAAQTSVPASDSKTPMVDGHLEVLTRVRDGTATPEQFKASFEAVLAKADAIRAELSAKTKAQLLAFGGPQVQWRHANSTKPDIVDAVYHEMLRDYALGETITHGLARDSYQNAVRRMVEATDADKLAQFVKERETELQEVKARGEARAQALESPQSLNDYRQFVAHHMQTHGETRMQAFMRLTPQQRVHYDALEAEGTKAQREQAKTAARTAVAAAGQAAAGEVIATKHTKLGHDLFVVQLAERVSREDYETLNASARRMGGSYSSYRGGGAVPGFQFRTREAAEAFQKLVGGDTQDAKAVADARRDAFEDDRSQSGIERLRAMAQALDERADASLGQERKANTARRARFAASAEAEARADKALAGTMRNLATAVEEGKAKFLDAVRQKVQVQALGQYLRSAKDAQVRAKYANYGDQQEHLRDPVDAETVDHAEFPSYTAMRSDLASVARQMLEVDGLKKLGARLGKVADDVTPAYTEWAKQNLTAVSQFARGDHLAEFTSREEAERALRRSAMTGRAIVLPIKRGLNRIVLAPGEAMRLGLWTGDGDKRITLSADFGRELVQTLGRRAGSAIKLPWTLEAALQKRKRLEGMGIFTAAEFRSALREFAGLEQGVAMPDKIKELERSMVGRRADGLDFFPTSAAVVDDMLAAAEIEPGMAVLEPSAGMGHIADAIRDDAGVTPDVVELSGERRELLEAKGHRLVGEDFMAMQRGEGYDRIIMNPPFSKGRDIEHVRHAYSLLKPGGRVVAIMGEGAFFQSNKNAEGFRQWLDELGASSEKLPEGSFADPSLPVNTGANARMVVIDKPMAQEGGRDGGGGAAMFGRPAGATGPVGDDGLAGMSPAVASAMRELSQPRPVDSAVMGMVREGRSAREVLGLIAGASRSRFNRQVARLLLKTGINPSMHLDNTDMGGEQGYRFLAKYSRANDAITMTDGALRQAEQIVLHELIHAATLRALDRKGLHSLQMRRLYEHVKRHGGAAGQYGMKNVGEFVAEVFTNPKFQRALQAMDAPGGGTLKTAWDSFVRILRSILGLSNDANSALAQALEIGVAVMREDMALRKKGVAGSGTAAMMASSRDSGDTESQRQFRETERAYGGRDGYQKAKDAGKTKLTYGQWVQVRTPNFIRWFGDHVIASAVPQRQASNFDQAREQAKAFQGKPLTNPASGIVATVSRNNLDKMLSEKAVDKSAAPALHSVAVANLDGLFERAILGWSKPDAKGDPNIKAIHRFFTPLLVDGEARLVKMTVKETGIASDPNPLYTVEAVEFNEKSPAAQWVAASLAADGLELTSIRSAGDVQSLAQRVQDFNPDAVSKVVDTETGEPLVVYHGTKADFDAFDIDTAPWNALRRLAAAVVPGFSSERAGERRAAFFTSSASGASTYATLDRTWGDAPNVMPVYLRIERPLVVDGARRMATTPSGEVVSVGEGASPNVLIDLAREHGADGVVIKDIEDAATGEAGADMYLAFADTQIKSATGNNGAFDPQDPDISHFGVGDITRMKSDALGRIDAAMKHPGTVSLWDKTVGTMRNLAERNPLFKPVYEAAQRFIDDVAMLANDAADRAPRVLPRVDSWRDLAKKPISAADNKAVAKPLFEGTLLWARDEQGKPTLVNDLEGRYASLSSDEKARKMLDAGRIDPGVLRMWQGLPKDQFDTLIESRFKSQMLKPGVVWSDKELADIFKMTPNQISLYREARKAIDRSIDMTARADMLRALGTEFADMRDVVLEKDSLGDAMELVISELQEQAKANPKDADRLMQLHNQVVDRATKARDLMDAGYAPLSRFGRYTVDVVGANGERQYFGMYESKADSNRALLQLRAAFPEAAVTQGTMSNEAFKLFSGITPESLELFGNMLGLDEEGGGARDRAFQEYLKLTKNNHSAIKRLIHRQGIAGFSEDVGRVLASFVYSNARQAAGGLNAGTMDRAVNAIPKSEGELKDVAMGLRGYIQDPQEEGQAVRGMLFAQYLGGSVASAFVNMTQPFAVTMPWLSQFGGIRGASAKLAQALKDMGTKGFKYEAELAQALKHAEDDGVVSPQEIHQLMAQARGSGSLRSGDGTRVGEAKAAASNAWERTKVAWGQPFALAEQFNRRLTFIAAYRIAKERNMADPAQFARRAVEETQFVYSKANKMRWGRGAIGGALMTFKSYSIQYLELLHRMWTQGGPQGKKAVGFAMVTLLLMGGAGGLPFMEDLEDLIDGIAQLMGINISSKQKRQEFLRSVVGKGLADFMEQGVSGLPGAPVDVSGRLGLGNLIPSTGLFMNKQNRERDLLELAGPAGDLLKRGFTGGRKLLTGDVGGAAMEVAPTAVRNVAKGIDMATSGMYKDAKGYKIIDTTLDEALAKAAGFQPKSVAEVQEANSFMMRSKSFYQQASAEIKAQWADALFRKDEKAVQNVRERLAKWNRDNPEQPIVVKMPDVWKRVREMGKDRTERIAATAPRALRQQMREMAAQAM